MDAPRTGLRHASEIWPRQLECRPDAEHDCRDQCQRRAEDEDRKVHLDHRLGGERVGRTHATISPSPRHAIKTPSAAPTTAIASASVRSCWTIRRRPAPRAARTASSCWRWVPRTSSRIETLAQPTSSSDATAPRSKIQLRAHRSREELDDAAEVDAERVWIACRCQLREFLEDWLQFGVRLRDGDAGLELQRRPVIDVRFEAGLERDIDVRFAPSEPRGHHADDLIVLANELDRASYHSGVSAVVALPELVPEDDDPLGILPGRGVCRHQPSSEEGRRAPVVWRIR